MSWTFPSAVAAVAAATTPQLVADAASAGDTIGIAAGDFPGGGTRFRFLLFEGARVSIVARDRLGAVSRPRAVAFRVVHPGRRGR